MNSLYSRSLARPFRYLTEPFDPFNKIKRMFSGLRAQPCRLSATTHAMCAGARTRVDEHVRKKIEDKEGGKKAH